MQLFQLKPEHKRKSIKRVGRGGKRGTYSGRGNKGQKSRAGRGVRPGFAGGDTTLAKRLPKLRGSVGPVKLKKGSKLCRRVKAVVLDYKKLNGNFKKSESISPRSLLRKGLINKVKGKMPAVKILGKNSSRNSFVFRGVKFSKGAGEKNKK